MERTLLFSTEATTSPAGSALDENTPILAVGETVILLHPPLPLVGVSIAIVRERQQNDSLAMAIQSPGWRCTAAPRLPHTQHVNKADTGYNMRAPSLHPY